MREKNPSSGGRSRGWGKRPAKAPKIWSFIWSRPVQATFGSLKHSNAGSLVICLCKSEIFHQGKDSKWMGKAHAEGVQPVAKAAAVKPVVGQWEGWFLCMGCMQAAILTCLCRNFLRKMLLVCALLLFGPTQCVTFWLSHGAKKVLFVSKENLSCGKFP